MSNTISRKSCEHEDLFFLEKYGVSAYDWRLQRSEYYENIWFRNIMSMSKIDADATSEALIEGHENLSDDGNPGTKGTKRPSIPIDKKDVNQFPYENVFFRQIPYPKKYKGVYDIIFMNGQSEPYIVDWFNRLGTDEKRKLNNIMSMIDDKIDMIRNVERPYYALSEVIVIGYCIKCLFYNEEISAEKLAQPKDLCTKEVHKFVDLFSKCFTMRCKRAVYVKDPDKQVIGMVPCKNFRHRYDQRYMLNINGWMSKKKWNWIED